MEYRVMRALTAGRAPQWGLLLLSWSVTACVHTNVAVLNPTVRYPRSCPEAVVVFTSAERVKGAYVEIALLNSKGDTDATTESEMIRNQQQAAAKVGANGLILGEISEPSAVAKIAAAVLKAETERKGRSVAIWIAADSARSRQICDSVARAKR